MSDTTAVPAAELKLLEEKKKLADKLTEAVSDNLLLKKKVERLEKDAKTSALNELSLLGQIQAANTHEAVHHCKDSKGQKHCVSEVMQASELCEKVKYRVLGEDAMVAILKKVE